MLRNTGKMPMLGESTKLYVGRELQELFVVRDRALPPFPPKGGTTNDRSRVLRFSCIAAKPC